MNRALTPSPLQAVRELLGADPLSWLLTSDEPYARWVTLHLVLGRREDDPSVVAAREDVLADADVRWLAEWQPEPDSDDETAGRAGFAANRLGLLADMGVHAGDFSAVDLTIDALLAQQQSGGLFGSSESHPGRPKPEAGSVLCDTMATTDALLRLGVDDDPRVRAAVARIRHDLAATPQGMGWRCEPAEKGQLFARTPASNDSCPQITLEGLRVLAQIPVAERPRRWLDAARTPLEAWRKSATERPCGFGHGFQFKSVRWPGFWYDVFSVLDAVGRFPELWSGPRARPQDRQAIAELAACLIEYNVDPDGRVTPRRTYPGFERFSFGRKNAPSPFATARTMLALVRIADLATDIAAVDLAALPSSRGAQAPVQPKRPKPVCPTPQRVPQFTVEQALTRVLIRHRLAEVWEPATVESLTADLIALNATTPASPHLALHARQTVAEPGAVDHAIHDRHSLTYLRAMRGALFAMRADFVPVAFGATRRQTEHFARRYARTRGVTPQVYKSLRPLVLEAVAEESLTAADIRSRIDVPTGVDAAALVNRLSVEGWLMRDRPRDGWDGHRWTWGPAERLLAGIEIDSVPEEDADLGLCRAYLRSFGPATAAEVAWWTGIGPRRTDRALLSLGDEVVSVRLADVTGDFLMHAADVDELSLAHVGQPLPPAFLPAYDPLLMGYSAKDRFVQPALRPHVFDSTGGCAPTVLDRGRVVGIWDVDERNHTVQVHLFTAAASAAVSAQAERAGRFRLGTDVSVEYVEKAMPVASLGAGAARRPLVRR